MQMPFGLYRGQPLPTVPAHYLLWVVSREPIRHSRWPLVEEVLRELRRRLERWDDLVAELRVTEQPPERWKTPQRAKRKAAERTEKLRLLEERRRQELRDETRKRMAYTLAHRFKVPSGIMTVDQIIEAWRAGTLPGQIGKPALGEDFSDLV